MPPLTAGPLAPLGKYFSQLGYVVTDTERTIAMFEGLGVTDFKRIKGGGDQYQTPSGETLTAASILVAFGTLGPIEIEIIEPVSSGNLYTDFLEASGPGLHHTGFNIPEYDEYRANYQRLLDLGGVPMNGRRIEGGQFNVEFCYFDCSSFQGSVVELTHFF